MPIYPENFVANSLSGTILVTNGFANVTLPTNPFALEGDKNFVIRIRKGGINGLVIATSPTITVRDPSQLVSLTANVSAVAEGNLVSFTLVTANAADNSNVFYSILPVTANVNTADFVGANVGRATIINNQATFSYFANADYSLMDETGETFRVQLRENNPTGNIIFTTSNVAITDFYKRINVFRFTESSRSIVEGTSVTFTISAQNLSTGTLLYYYTSGNADITASNTGSIAMNSVSNTITITTSPTVPTDGSRSFNLILSETNLGTPIATSNAITVIDSSLAYLNATGGTVTTIDGFRIHTFTTSGNLLITNASTAAINTANILSIAGGGGGGDSRGGGGGGGGFVFQSGLTLNSNLEVRIGSGGAWRFSGSNTTVTGGSISINSVGGGRGGGGPGQPEASPGGSGGGARSTAFNPVSVAGANVFGQGFPGGADAGGGGGAGEQGFTSGPPGAPTGGPARGGNGRPSLITGANVIYAGGGGGKGTGTPSGWPGGTGGGGASAPESTPYAPSGTPGTVNTGGGGGAGVEATGSAGGTGGSGVVIIRYPWVPPAGYASVTANSSAIAEGTNAFFVVNTTFANNSILYYDTLGNVTSASFVGGNTGSFVVTGNTTVIRLQTTTVVPLNEERMFALRIREDSATTGNIRLVSSNVYVYDSAVSLYIDATGGTVLTANSYRTHFFTSSNNFVVTSAGKFGGTIEYFMVAGGGSGGYGYGPGGGGGAGGVLFGNSPVVANTYVVTIGAAGAGTTGSGTNGGNTSVIGATTIGPGVVAVGGGGASASGVGGLGSGGSGGGGTFGPSTVSPGPIAGGSGYGFFGTIGSTMQGYPGGAGGNYTGSPTNGGGGGGAGGVGNPTPSPTGNGPGGVGISSPLSPSIPTSYGTGGPSSGRWFAGGGGGGGTPGNPGGNGGSGGGGKGAAPFEPGLAGNVNTGGGGGAGNGNPNPPGGSGIVIIRYPYI